MSNRCDWCGREVEIVKVRTMNKHSGWLQPYRYCNSEERDCRRKAQKSGSAYYGNHYLPPVERMRRKSLFKAARKGSKKAQGILREEYFMTGIWNPAINDMVRW